MPHKAFPDLWVKIEGMAAESDRVAERAMRGNRFRTLTIFSGQNADHCQRKTLPAKSNSMRFACKDDGPR